MDVLEDKVEDLAQLERECFRDLGLAIMAVVKSVAKFGVERENKKYSEEDYQRYMLGLMDDLESMQRKLFNSLDLRQLIKQLSEIDNGSFSLPQNGIRQNRILENLD